MTSATSSLNIERNKTLGLALVIVLGLGLTVILSRSLEAHRPPVDPNAVDESLYLSGNMARRMSLGFNGLAADWYWMRSLQYVGGKIINLPEDVELDNLGQLNLKVLAPLLDTATTLDPQFLDPYEYAAVVLPAVDVNEAIRITRKGIEANPTAWRLHQHLGYIYWQQQNYTAAAETYKQGAAIPGVPPWMKAMYAKMVADGGSRSTAREIYSRMYEQSTDDKVKEMAQRRLMQLDALDQLDSLNKFLASFQSRLGRCPASWKELEPVFRGMRVALSDSGAPLDPSGSAYVFGTTNCEVKISPDSKVPVR